LQLIAQYLFNLLRYIFSTYCAISIKDITVYLAIILRNIFELYTGISLNFVAVYLYTLSLFDFFVSLFGENISLFSFVVIKKFSTFARNYLKQKGSHSFFFKE
jgi:hypothetical protein